MVRIIGGYAAAVLATYVFGAIFISQGNIANVIGMGFEVSVAQRFESMLHDVSNMTDLYLPVVAVSFVIALSVAAIIIRFYPGQRLVGYTLAGFAALIAVHVLVKTVFGISGIAPTRTIVGLLAQGLAGAIGGYVFHLVTAKKNLLEQ